MMTTTAMIACVGVVLPFLGAVGIDALGDGVAVDAEGFSGVRNALLIPGEGLLNIELLEFRDGLIKGNVAVQHIVDHCF